MRNIREIFISLKLKNKLLNLLAKYIYIIYLSLTEIKEE